MDKRIQIVHDTENQVWEIELVPGDGSTYNLVSVWYGDTENELSMGFASMVASRIEQALSEILQEHGGLSYAVR